MTIIRERLIEIIIENAGYGEIIDNDYFGTNQAANKKRWEDVERKSALTADKILAEIKPDWETEGIYKGGLMCLETKNGYGYAPMNDNDYDRKKILISIKEIK
mgnify:FL=1